jgi:hypothetical protein
VSALVVAKEAYALGPDQVIPIYQASAPGSEAATQTESRDLVFGEPRLRNVTHPTLSVYLPRPGVASGAAVIIAPGGGFMMLSVQSEGEQVAHWLMRHGVAAIVLKYRLNETPSNLAEFESDLVKLMTPRPDTQAPLEIAKSVGAVQAQEDGHVAIRLVRERAQRK